MAVFTSIDLEKLKKFLKSYNVGDLLSYEGIAEGNENSNYLIKTTKGKFILTLYEKRVKEKDLPFFIELMHHLFRNGIQCPKPDFGGSCVFCLFSCCFVFFVFLCFFVIFCVIPKFGTI